MATTTPNFGWAVPTSTDLVKDGAVAIETLGDSIDASLVDLKGGTTGQVLKKATNTDMDFVWSADSAGMTNPMTTTGDTIYSSSGSTPARLGIGSTGQVLTVSGGVPTWATPAGGGGKVLQVVSATTSTGVTISSTTNTDTGITATITPTSASSKILVLISGSVYGSASSVAAFFYGGRLLRGGTTIMDQGAYGLAGIQGSTSTMGTGSNVAINYYDSPATTSATTYKFQARTQTTGALYWQQDSLSASTIVLMEIGA
jgi:hypothetical protein